MARLDCFLLKNFFSRLLDRSPGMLIINFDYCPYKIRARLQNKGYVPLILNKISMHSVFERPEGRHIIKMILNEKLMIEDEN